MAEPLVHLRGLSVRFGATAALEGVDLEVMPGTVHAVVGENGAGKSTLLRALAGFVAGNAAAVRVLGAAGLPRSPSEAARRGVGYAPQELSLCAELTVAEQATLGREPRSRTGLVDRRAQRERAGILLGQIGASLEPSVRVGSLGASDRKRLQIARALAGEPRLLLLDEPSAALDAPAAAAVARLARALARRGVAVLLVSHHVEAVLAQADVVTVLRDGRLVSTTPAQDLDAHALLARMVGRDLPARTAATRGIAAAPPHLRLPPPIDRTLHAGEIFGLFGLVGAGRSRLLEALAARMPGAALVPEERAAKGLVPTLSVRENLFLPARGAWLRPGRERREAAEWSEKLRIRGPGPDAPIGALSGGNQQKVLLARALARRPDVLLLDEPTQGVDVGAKADLHDLVLALARDGASLVLSSSDLPELLALSHRIGVVREGRLAGVLEGEVATEASLLALACGIAA